MVENQPLPAYCSVGEKEVWDVAGRRLPFFGRSLHILEPHSLFLVMKRLRLKAS